MTGYTQPDLFPYPDDYAAWADSPAALSALAQAVQTATTKLAGYAETALTPAAGWADLGGSLGGMHVTKVGRLVVIAAVLKPTADKAMVIGGGYPIATVPAGFLPLTGVVAGSPYITTGTNTNTGRVSLTSTGTLNFFIISAATITAATGWVAVNLAYRSALT